MPYASVDDLPPSFKNLSPAQKSKAREMLNAMLKQEGMDEGQAIATALKRVKTMKLTEIRTITLAEPPAADGDVSAPFEILRTGTFQHSVYGKLTVTEADLDKAAANFERMMSEGHQPSIDYDHAFATKGDSKAAGWIESVKRAGKSLMAQVKWTPKAASAIGDGEYRYFSPEFNERWKDQNGEKWGFTLLAGGLTNRPFLKGMAPVALSEAVAELVSPATEEKSEKADDLRSVDETEKPNGDEAPNGDDAGNGDDGGESGGEDQAARTLAETPEGKLLTEENKRLHERVESLEGKIFDQDFARIFGEARRSGRVDAKDETEKTWRDRAEKWGMEDVEKLLSELPTYIPVDERGRAGEPEEIVFTEDDVDPDRERLHRRATQYVEEHEGVTYTEAVVRLSQEK